jgi:hypothetical protein
MHVTASLRRSVDNSNRTAGYLFPTWRTNDPSPLILAEYYEAGDADVFLQHLLAYRGNWRPLLGVIERWKHDHSPRATKLKLLHLSHVIHLGRVAALAGTRMTARRRMPLGCDHM